MKVSSIRENFDNLIFKRVSKLELQNNIEDFFGLKSIDIDSHFNDGKTFFDNIECDDFYSFDIEYEKGKDVYMYIYFLPTNEKDIKFITEVSLEFNEF